ncbi:hypothetical protein ACHHYP_05836 [Achlya hypogyna]|uniref:Uncharacterized protein n=1 Tax=Achlya hypogyna TaxID=1202772 RepID=A0A1V9YWJ0_ACHHY|nr:hypothetical protein ACHHYP_05836 [Achlya hypogyna]
MSESFLQQLRHMTRPQSVQSRMASRRPLGFLQSLHETRGTSGGDACVPSRMYLIIFMSVWRGTVSETITPLWSGKLMLAPALTSAQDMSMNPRSIAMCRYVVPLMCVLRFMPRNEISCTKATVSARAVTMCTSRGV